MVGEVVPTGQSILICLDYRLSDLQMSSRVDKENESGALQYLCRPISPAGRLAVSSSW